MIPRPKRSDQSVTRWGRLTQRAPSTHLMSAWSKSGRAAVPPELLTESSFRSRRSRARSRGSRAAVPPELLTESRFPGELVELACVPVVGEHSDRHVGDVASIDEGL